MELKKFKKLVSQLEKDLESQQEHNRASSRLQHHEREERERELEERLEEHEREIHELRRQRAHQGEESEDIVRELEAHNAQLEEEIENMRELLQDNMDEIERLKDLIERNSSSFPSDQHSTRSHLQRIHDLQDENADLRHRLQDHIALLSDKNDEREDLLDAVESLKLEIEELHSKRAGENEERSESRALILEEREGREQVEDDLNNMKDRVAALLIEIQQKEDECEQKNAEIDELVAEHKRIVEVVEDEWRGEVDEVRMQVEELKDVSLHLLSFRPCSFFRFCLNEKRNCGISSSPWMSTKRDNTNFASNLNLPLPISNFKPRPRMLRLKL